MSDQRALVPYMPNASDTVSLILRYPTSEQPHMQLDIRIKAAGLEPNVVAFEIAECVVAALKRTLRDFFWRRLHSPVSEEAWRPRIILRTHERQATECEIELIPLQNSCPEPSDLHMFHWYCRHTIEILLEQPGCLTWHFFRRHVI